MHLLARGSGTIALGALTTAFAVIASAADAPKRDAEEAPGLEELLETGRQLWEEHAPAEIREQYEFPDRGTVEEFLATLQRAFSDGSFEELAAYEFDARGALLALRQFEGGDELVAWLEPRLDLLTAAGAALAGPGPSPAPRAPPTRPGEAAPVPRPAVSPAVAPAPLTRSYWDRIVVGRHPPARAGEFVPRLKEVFAAEGVPAAWVWIAEVESSMNPRARSPVGARGLFQFMPETAERFGLRTSLPDERIDPVKSARAAARYLRVLHERFDSWPLAVAAYNAGEGRVGRALAASGARTFSEVARHLPAETRLYVPKVMATVAAREAVDPENLPPPRP